MQTYHELQSNIQVNLAMLLLGLHSSFKSLPVLDHHASEWLSLVWQVENWNEEYPK